MKTILKKVLPTAALLLLLGLGVFSLFAWNYIPLIFEQSKQIYFPKKPWTATPFSAGLAYENVKFPAADGVRLSGWFVEAQNPAGVILLCHGNAGNISHRLGELRLYHGLGLSTFIFDYRGYGKSEGRVSEKGTYLDAEGAWKYLVEKKGFRPDEIIFAGRSLGAAVAVDLAVKHPPRALIIESGFTSLPDIASELYPRFPIRLFLRYHYDSMKKLPKIKCPVFVIHSRDDQLVPFHHGQKLFAAANEPKMFLEISGPHNEGYQQSEDKYREGLKAFLKGTR
ncbi:MAG: alpha/beta hydrolase [Candidatus Omnitrophota bacterium]